MRSESGRRKLRYEARVTESECDTGRVIMEMDDLVKVVEAIMVSL